MSLVELICYVVEYTIPRLRALGWCRGTWQLVSVICEAVRFYDGTFFERRRCTKEYLRTMSNLNGPIHVADGNVRG